MLFSIIVPFYKVEKYARSCIESILHQTESDFELILVDDGSPDSVPLILDKYAEKDSRIKVIHKKNGGLVNARKVGTQIANGKYVVVVDGDDWLKENYLSTFKVIIDKYAPDMICCGYYQVNEICKKMKKIISFPLNLNFVTNKDLEKIKENIFAFAPNVWGKVFRRELYYKYLMTLDERIIMGEDGMVVFPLLTECNSIYFIDDALYYYRYNPTSLTHTKDKNIDFSSVLFRLEHLDKMLPIDLYKRENQLSKYACHSLINAVFSQYNRLSFREVNRQLDLVLSQLKEKGFLEYKPIYATKKEKIAYFILTRRCFLLMKIISILINM